MTDTELDVPVDASTATDRDSWLELIEQIGAEEGSFHTLGPRHWALMVEDGRKLVVSFETMASARARQGQMPLVHHIAAEMGWSHLCLIAEDQTWFRDPWVYAYFDRLVDEAFFDDFDRVLFYGAGPMGYAACAFSVTAPGARCWRWPRQPHSTRPRHAGMTVTGTPAGLISGRATAMPPT